MGYVAAHMGEAVHVYSILVGKPMEITTSGLDVYWKIILKCILYNVSGVDWIHLVHDSHSITWQYEKLCSSLRLNINCYNVKPSIPVCKHWPI